MATDSKAKQQKLIESLYKARASAEVRAVLDLLDLLFEDAKDKLVTESGEELLRRQGDARTYKLILRRLTQAPLPSETTREP